MPLILMFKSEHFKVWCVLLLLSVITHSIYITLKLKSVIPFLKVKYYSLTYMIADKEENVLETEIMETDYLGYNLRN